MSRTYVITKGKHSSGIYFAPFVGTKIGATFSFAFYPEYYSNVQTREQINKLFGVAHFYHHWNSLRMGWREDVNTNSIEIFSYVYIGGIRRINSIGFVDPFSKNKFTIEIENGEAHFRINEYTAESIKFPYIKIIGYKLFPYFGGENPAESTKLIKQY